MALSVWRVEIHAANGYFRQTIIPLVIDASGRRLPTGETVLTDLHEVAAGSEELFDQQRRVKFVSSILPDALRREVEHRGLLREGASLTTQLSAWIELT